MCRSDDHRFGSHRPGPNSNRLLTATAFYLKLKLDSGSGFRDNTLTLLCLPRINGCPLEVNGSMIRPESPAYVTLYRLINSGVDDAGESVVVFGSTERIRVGEGARFEVYIGEEKLLKGVFRRGVKGEGWRVECTCVLETELAVEEAEVCVAGEGGRMREKVVVAERRRRRRRRGGLEEIPEEVEEEDGAWDDGVSSATSCSSSCECGCESGSDGWEEEEDRTAEIESEMEGVRWAVDVGIWVVCLGVGYMTEFVTLLDVHV
ncbi:hypothetical protein V2J09_014581 [Rumex salicifolius]